MPSTIFSKPLNKQVAQNAADIAALSTNLANANGALAIVATGNTAPKAISAGQFVFWNGGIHTANSAIASGETLSSSNLTAVPDGGLNAINDDVVLLNDRVANLPNYTTCNALSNVETYLSSVASGLSDGQIQTIYIVTGSSFDSSAFGKAERYAGELKRMTSTQFVCSLSSRLGDSVDIGYYNGTFKYNNLSEQIAKCLSFINKDIEAGSNSFTISNSARIIFYSFSTSTAKTVQYMISTSSSGGVTIKEIASGSNITVSSSGNNSLTISNSSTAASGYFVIISGSIA